MRFVERSFPQSRRRCDHADTQAQPQSERDSCRLKKVESRVRMNEEHCLGAVFFFMVRFSCILLQVGINAIGNIANCTPISFLNAVKGFAK